MVGVTAALKYPSPDFAGALLGVEHSARGFRWIERLDPGRALIATSIAQAHGLPELLGRVLAARGADSHSVARYLDPALKTLLPDPVSPPGHGEGRHALCRRHTGQRADRRVRRLRRRRRGLRRA